MDSPEPVDNTAATAPAPQPTRSSESKPRLSKEAQDLLERHFAAEPKPSTNTKKGFAGELGVPLDKINNWFQNRRAKVKQDAKKARNQQSYDLFYHNGFSSDGLNTESFINPSFYTTVDPGMPHPILVNDPGMQMPPEMLIAPFQTAPQFMQALPAHQQQQFATYAAYNPEPELTQFFGLDSGAIANGQAIDPNSVVAFGDQFKPQYIAVPGAADLDAFPRGHALYAMSSDESMQMHPSSMGQMQMHVGGRHPSSSMTSMTTGYSANSRTSSTSWASPSDGEAPQMPFNLRNLRDRMDSINQHSVNQTVLEEPIPDFDALHPSSDEPSSLSMPGDSLTATTAISDFQKHLSIDTSMPSTCAPSALVFHAAPESSSSQSERLSPAFSTSSEAGPSPTNTITPRTSTSSSLALRRQKRPVALGITSMHRSTSYSAAVPNSPGSLAVASEQASLRRIKSSHHVMTGRIQKSGASSAQRSPMSLSFKEADGTQSPRVPRHFPSVSRLNDDNKTTHSIAEHEEEDSAGHEIDMDASSIWHQMPSTAGTSFSSAMWSQAPTTGDSISFTSAPPTPLDLHNFEQMRMRNASIPNMSHVVPSSAPPWQESFSSDMSAGTDSDMVMDPQLAFRPSTSSGPEGLSHMMSTDGPGFMQILPDGMLTPSGNASNTAQGHIPMYAMHSDSSMMPPPPLIVPSSELSATPRLGPKLHIQAWEPREVPEEADLPPKRASASLPKNYQFNNQFSTSFINPSTG